MRIAFISDLHANLVALDAVLDDIAHQQVDSLICLGDVGDLGPQPAQVIARLRELDCQCIMGNHDVALLEPGKAPQLEIPPSLIEPLHWCLQRLKASDLNFVRSFKPRLEIALDAKTSVLCFHGSPQSNTAIILATTPADELDRLLGDTTSTVMIGGHTHLPLLHQHQGRLVVNPGSVGNAFRSSPRAGMAPTLLPWAQYAILSSRHGIVSVDLRRVAFDIAQYVQIIQASDIPMREWLLDQYANNLI